VIQDPHSGQTSRVLIRPLSATRWSAWVDAGKPESSLGDDDPEREGAAGQPLTIQAMARVDQQRLLGDFIALPHWHPPLCGSFIRSPPNGPSSKKRAKENRNVYHRLPLL
jgi:hypothetical protein